MLEDGIDGGLLQVCVLVFTPIANSFEVTLSTEQQSAQGKVWQYAL